MTGRKRQKMIRIEECILYRDFAEGEVLRDMTILVETYKKLVNAQISLKDRRFRENMSAYEPQFYEALNRLVEMANRYGFSGNLWHDYLTFLLGEKQESEAPKLHIDLRYEVRAFGEVEEEYRRIFEEQLITVQNKRI